MKFFILCALLAIFWSFPSAAFAAGFGDYEGGVLKIEPPRIVRIYKKGSSTSKSISIGASSYSIQDARWQGSELVVTLVEKNGRQTVRVYKDTASYRTVR
jgi:hypothetical protein